MAKHDSSRRTSASNKYQNWHQEQILESVVQHDRMPKRLKVRELNGPADVCNAPCDLSIDKIAKSANTHDVRAGDG
jgi:hypothetical protein